MGMSMSDGSLSRSQQPLRPLRSDERELVQALSLGIYPAAVIERKLADALVGDMLDGGMGSIRFAIPEARDRRFGQVAATAEYVDSDSVLVSIALNLDEQGDIFEVDFWKVDFSPLRRYPHPRDLKMLEVSRVIPQKSEPVMTSRS
jgi:hypothetical protein